MSDSKRAYDHYRWAERYNKAGDHEKAAAHMKRAMHYGRTGFGMEEYDKALKPQLEQKLCVWVFEGGKPVLYEARENQRAVIDELINREKLLCTNRPTQLQVFPSEKLITETVGYACFSALRFDKGQGRQTRFHNNMYIITKGGELQGRHTYEDAVQIGNSLLDVGFPWCLNTQTDHQLRLIEDWRPGKLKIFVFDEEPVDDPNVPASVASSSTVHRLKSRWHDAKPYQKYAYFKFMRDTKYGTTGQEIAFRNKASEKVEANLIPEEFLKGTGPRNQIPIDFTIFRHGPDGCVYLRRANKVILRMSDCSVLQCIADSAYRAFVARMTDHLDPIIMKENPFYKQCPICHKEKKESEINAMTVCQTQGCAECRDAIERGEQCPCGKKHASVQPCGNDNCDVSVAKKQKSVANEAQSVWTGSPYELKAELTWFKKLFGVHAEDSRKWVHENARIVPESYSATYGTSEVKSSKLVFTDRSFVVGSFKIPMLKDLYKQVYTLGTPTGLLKREKLLIGPAKEIKCVSELHVRKENRLATFQVASQFNCLEMRSNEVTPERGIAIYETDKTQGPACSIACGAATLYRNYFAQLCTDSGDVQNGQTDANQINTLKDALTVIGDPEFLLTFKNGYIDATAEQLSAISAALANPQKRERMKAKLRVGFHSDVQVTSSNWGANPHISEHPHLVTQVFCSACPVSYSSRHGGSYAWSQMTAKAKKAIQSDWESLAKLVLEATYEATMCAAVINAHLHGYQAGSNRVFLTRVGAGVFGNADEWVDAAINSALEKFKDYNLLVFEVVFVSS